MRPYCRPDNAADIAASCRRRLRLLAAGAALFLLAGCGGSGAPAGGMNDNATAASSTIETSTSLANADQPGFLTATPPPGGGGGPSTPPPGGLGPTSTASPTTHASATTVETVARTRAAATGTAGKPAASPTATPFQTPSPEPTDTPVPVGTAPAQAIQVSMAAPATVNRGGSATIQATTNVPGAICTLTVRYRTASSSPAPQFPIQTADPNGSVAWTWTIPQDVVPGTWPVTVRCQIGLPLNDPDAVFAYANNLLPVK